MAGRPGTRHGLWRPSFIPPPPIRVLRDLARHRKVLVELRTQEIKRVHKVLETANLKLGAVASNVVGVSGRHMLRAIEAGESDPAVLAELATGRLREQLLMLRRALAGRVQPHQRLLLGELLDHITYREQAIHRLEGSVADLVAEQETAIRLLLTLPATGPVAAAALLAEIGTDMARCPSAHHLASWAGVCPGNRGAPANRAAEQRPKAPPSSRPSCASSRRPSPARQAPLCMRSSTASRADGANHGPCSPSLTAGW